LQEFAIASAIELPIDPDNTAGAFVCENFHILQDIVLRSNCVWLSSPDFAGPKLRSGELVSLNIQGNQFTETEVSLLVRRGRSLAPAAVAVASEIEAIMAVVSQASGTSGHPDLPLAVRQDL